MEKGNLFKVATWGAEERCSVTSQAACLKSFFGVLLLDLGLTGGKRDSLLSIPRLCVVIDPSWSQLQALLQGGLTSCRNWRQVPSLASTRLQPFPSSSMRQIPAETVISRVVSVV